METEVRHSAGLDAEVTPPWPRSPPLLFGESPLYAGPKNRRVCTAGSNASSIWSPDDVEIQQLVLDEDQGANSKLDVLSLSVNEVNSSCASSWGASSTSSTLAPSPCISQEGSPSFGSIAAAIALANSNSQALQLLQLSPEVASRPRKASMQQRLLQQLHLQHQIGVTSNGHPPDVEAPERKADLLATEHLNVADPYAPGPGTRTVGRGLIAAALQQLSVTRHSSNGDDFAESRMVPSCEISPPNAANPKGTPPKPWVSSFLQRTGAADGDVLGDLATPDSSPLRFPGSRQVQSAGSVVRAATMIESPSIAQVKSNPRPLTPTAAMFSYARQQPQTPPNNASFPVTSSPPKTHSSIMPYVRLGDGNGTRVAEDLGRSTVGQNAARVTGQAASQHGPVYYGQAQQQQQQQQQQHSTSIQQMHQMLQVQQAQQQNFAQQRVLALPPGTMFVPVGNGLLAVGPPQAESQTVDGTRLTASQLERGGMHQLPSAASRTMSNGSAYSTGSSGFGSTIGDSSRGTPPTSPGGPCSASNDEQAAAMASLQAAALVAGIPFHQLQQLLDGDHSGSDNNHSNGTTLADGIPVIPALPGVDMHSASTHGLSLFCDVEFKRGRRVRYQCDFPVAQGEYVIVGGDRGRHMGRTRCTYWANPLAVMQAAEADNSAAADAATNGNSNYDSSGNGRDSVIGKVVRRATTDEVAFLHASLRWEESKAVRFCQKQAWEHELQMVIVDCEFQFDCRKVTFYYVSKERVDFKELVRDLYRKYRARIWMNRLDYADQTA